MPRYRERLWPAPWVFAAITLVIPATLLVFWPINFVVGIVVAVVFFVGCCALLLISSPTIEVDDRGIRAGNARLPIAFVGEVSSHFGADATLERGQRLDARAWLLVRGWVAPIAKIEVTDPADPVPYWIVSSRTPDRLASAIREAQAIGSAEPDRSDG